MADKSKYPTIKALHNVINGDPMAAILAPAVQAGVSLAARLGRDHPTFWAQMSDEVLAMGDNVEGLVESENVIMTDLIAAYDQVVKGANGDGTGKRKRSVRRAN